MTDKPAPNIDFEIDEDALLNVEYTLPPIEDNLEEQAELERERYDEMILGGLVSP